MSFPTTLYVSENGYDENTGSSEDLPLKTISKACELANSFAMTDTSKQNFEIIVLGELTGSQSITADGNYIASICVRGGTYDEDNPEELTDLLNGCFSDVNTGRTLSINTNASVELRNIKITGGYTTESGAGIYVTGGISDKPSTITIQNCEISGNTSEDNGGGIYAINKGTLVLRNTKVLNNTIYAKRRNAEGAGIYSSTTLCLDGVRINGNRALDSNPEDDKITCGGGIYSSGNIFICGETYIGDPELSEKPDYTTDTYGNCSAYQGGGIYLFKGNLYLGYSGFESDGVTPVEAHTSGGIYGNWSQKGGGIYMGLQSHVYMAGGTIENNIASNNDSGNGVFCESTSRNYNTQDSNHWTLEKLFSFEIKGDSYLSAEDTIKLGYYNFQDGSSSASPQHTDYGTITVAGELTNSSQRVAIISPSSTIYQVLSAKEGLTLSDRTEKFLVTQTFDKTRNYGSTSIHTANYSIKADGKIGSSLGITTKEKPDTVGDLVLSDGTAVCYDAYSGMSEEQKNNIIAIIFYANGIDLNPAREPRSFEYLGNRMLGIGIKNSRNNGTETSTPMKLFDYTNNEGIYSPAWASSVFASSALNCKPQKELADYGNYEEATKISEINTDFEGTNDGSTAWENFVTEMQTSSVTEDDLLNVFDPVKYAKNYGSICNLPEKFKEGWYVPSIAELTAIFKVYGKIDTVSNQSFFSMTKILSTASETATPYFWSISHAEDENNENLYYCLQFKKSPDESTSEFVKMPCNVDTAETQVFTLVIRDFTND